MNDITLKPNSHGVFGGIFESVIGLTFIICAIRCGVQYGKPFEISTLTLFGVIFFSMGVLTTACEGRTVCFNEKGVELRFLSFQRSLSWKEIVTRYHEFWVISKNIECEAIFFSTKRYKKPKSKWGIGHMYSSSLHPLTSFYVTLIPKNDMQSKRRYGYPYGVDKYEFLVYLQQINVSVERIYCG